MKKTIFTFWEPADAMPAYIRLCIETWRRHLPEYEIVVLDYSNIYKYIPKDLYDDVLWTDFSIAKQSDALTAALLERHGGIWLDADTVITSPKARDILEAPYDFAMIGRHLAFATARKGARVARRWRERIQERLLRHKAFKAGGAARFFINLFHRNFKERAERFDFLGNGAIGKAIKEAKNDEFYSFDKDKLGAFPEISWAKSVKSMAGKDAQEIYRRFYFDTTGGGNPAH
ncbi:MAG: capsular polysaccharide synthesis protein [Rickettsiales bacterium]|jgi:hypothetical protein|nr:capsular polysaccharide synthesis protein [Rickettsiales bacterium]